MGESTSFVASPNEAETCHLHALGSLGLPDCKDEIVQVGHAGQDAHLAQQVLALLHSFGAKAFCSDIASMAFTIALRWITACW
jgi:hypothetical protein